MKNISLLILCLFLFSCDDPLIEMMDNNNKTNDKVTELDKLFTNGFQMKLEQIYVMNDQNSIPLYDSPIDSLFNQPSTIGNLPNYYYDNYIGNYMLYSLTKGETWNISKMYKDSVITYIEHGYGSNYSQSVYTTYHTYNFINCKNEYTDRRFYFLITLGNIYNYRGHDNHELSIKVLDDGNSLLVSNLWLTVLTDNGNALFDKGYIYFDTNKQYNIGYTISAPLTSNQVKQIINSGYGYELYIQNGIIYYKIDENLYIPRYGDSYVYAGTTNQSGMINSYVCKYYRFKFKIVWQ